MDLFDNLEYAELVQTVKSYYQQPHRVFHDWLHIHTGVIAAKEIGGEFDWTMAQQLAWLFHDIVYIPGAHDNEKRSVQLMNVIIAMFKRDGIDFGLDEYVSAASTIIYATAQHNAVNESCRAVLDIDMMCFSTPRLLRRANQEIAKEFNLTELSGRIAFLESLNEREIYHTEFAKSHWEQNAHKNITASINLLRKGTL